MDPLASRLSLSVGATTSCGSQRVSIHPTLRGERMSACRDRVPRVRRACVISISRERGQRQHRDHVRTERALAPRSSTRQPVQPTPVLPRAGRRATARRHERVHWLLSWTRRTVCSRAIRGGDVASARIQNLGARMQVRRAGPELVWSRRSSALDQRSDVHAACKL
jgi:hypothetical protein